MSEAINAVGIKISGMKLLDGVTGEEQVPTGNPGSKAVSLNQIKQYTLRGLSMGEGGAVSQANTLVIGWGDTTGATEYIDPTLGLFSRQPDATCSIETVPAISNNRPSLSLNGDGGFEVNADPFQFDRNASFDVEFAFVPVGFGNVEGYLLGSDREDGVGDFYFAVTGLSYPEADYRRKLVIRLKTKTDEWTTLCISEPLVSGSRYLVRLEVRFGIPKVYINDQLINHLPSLQGPARWYLSHNGKWFVGAKHDNDAAYSFNGHLSPITVRRHG